MGYLTLLHIDPILTMYQYLFFYMPNLLILLLTGPTIDTNLGIVPQAYVNKSISGA